MKVNEIEVSVRVPCKVLSVSVGKLALSIEVTGDNQLFVWCNNKKGPYGIKIPIGRVADAIEKLIDAEFKRQEGE
jgi:hypothetical protein